MTLILYFILVISILGFFAVVYAVKEAWKDYKLSILYNGWRNISARAQLRSALFAFAEGGMLTSAIAIGLIFPKVETRPTWATLILRFLLLVPISLIALNAILEMRVRKRVLKSK